MKKLLLSLMMIALGFCLFAGGIVTNTNQSAAWVRMPARDASVGIDAAYFNPAGLTKLEDGFHISVNNQTLIQRREISNAYPYLTGNKTYKGDVFVPFFPTAYMVYKTGKFAFSGAFCIVGGGGSATYKQGLPSFEIPVSNLVPSLSFLQDVEQIPGINKDLTVDNYSVDLSFDGLSVYYGMQAGVSYEINDMISVAVAGRYVIAKNTYEGHIKDISVYRSSGAVGASDFLNNDAIPAVQQAIPTLQGVAMQASQGADQISQGIQAGVLDPNAQADANTLAGLQAMGIPATGLTYQQAAGAYQLAASEYNAKATQLQDEALPALQAQSGALGDKYVDVEQTGTGFTPILGVNLSLLEEKLNVGIKYEFRTEIEIENNTTKDDVYMFPDKEKKRGDMPALFSIGAEYKILPELTFAAGYHYYFDKDADYGKSDAEGHTGNDYFIDENSFEVSLALAYDLSEKIKISGGYLYTSTGQALAYQTDMSYALKGNSFGFGGKFNITPRFSCDLGIFFTQYIDGEKYWDNFTISGNPVPSVKETYAKNNTSLSIGFNYRFGGEE